MLPPTGFFPPLDWHHRRIVQIFEENTLNLFSGKIRKKKSREKQKQKKRRKGCRKKQCSTQAGRSIIKKRKIKRKQQEIKIACLHWCCSKKNDWGFKVNDRLTFFLTFCFMSWRRLICFSNLPYLSLFRGGMWTTFFIENSPRLPINKTWCRGCWGLSWKFQQWIMYGENET